MTSYDEHLTEAARLVMLTELGAQTAFRLNEIGLTLALDAAGYAKSREWVRTQLNKLSELGAVKVTRSGAILVASITQAGLDHIERRSVLDGVARPAPEA